MKIHYSGLVLALVLVISPVLAADDTGQENNPWYWYNKAVDLANEGKFTEALVANEKALAINQSMPVAWANEAGILVQLGRYDEAITAADRGLADNSTDLPNTYAAAYYSKGDALRALGRTAEAREAYAHANALDSTLVPPDLSGDTPRSTTAASTTTLPPATSQLPVTNPASSGVQTAPVTTPRSPVTAGAGIAAACAAILCAHARKSA